MQKSPAFVQGFFYAFKAGYFAVVFRKVIELVISPMA